MKIQVKDRPEAPTRIGITPKAAIMENAKEGTVVGQLYAVDSDEEDTHSFTLVEQPQEVTENKKGPFHINSSSTPLSITRETNELFAIKKDPFGKHVLIITPSRLRIFVSHYLDFEKHPYVPVYIRATDSKGLSVEQIVKIQLEDENEKPADIKIIRPGVKEKKQHIVRNEKLDIRTITEYVDSQVKAIPENLKPASTVGELIAEIRDEADQLSFTLIEHPSGVADDNHLFEVVKQSTGQSYLRVAPGAKFNHQEKQVLVISMSVQEQTNLEAMEQVQLEVKPGFEVDLEAKVVSSKMKPGDAIGNLSSTVPFSARLTGVLDVAYNEENELLILKGNGKVLGVEKIKDEFTQHTRSTTKTKLVSTVNSSYLFDDNFPWRLKGKDDHFNYYATGIYRYQTGNLKKYDTYQLPISLRELQFSDQKISLMHMPTRKVQAIAKPNYIIKDDGTLWRWSSYMRPPEQIQTNPSAILPEGTFNTFFRIKNNQLRLAKPVPDVVDQMKIHVEGINGEGLRIEEVFVLEVERE